MSPGLALVEQLIVRDHLVLLGCLLKLPSEIQHVHPLQTQAAGQYARHTCLSWSSLATREQIKYAKWQTPSSCLLVSLPSGFHA